MRKDKYPDRKSDVYRTSFNEVETLIKRAVFGTWQSLICQLKEILCGSLLPSCPNEIRTHFFLRKLSWP